MAAFLFPKLNAPCVAMSELISGTESAFVEKMNEKARQLGMSNTTFENCCGLDTEGHLSTARDVAIMSKYLINEFPDIHNYSTIWMDTIIHETRKGQSEFGLSNTNKLIKQYQYATGLKTGSTGMAKCCLSATATKDDVNLIAVIMAAPNSKTRFAEATSLPNYGFSKCNVYKDNAMPLLEPIDVKNGVDSKTPVQYEGTFSYMFAEKYDEPSIHNQINIEKTEAPICAGEKIGTIEYFYGDKKLGSVDIVAVNDNERAGFSDIIKKLLKAVSIAE